MAVQDSAKVSMSTDALTIERVAQTQTNVLYDVVALLAAVADRVDMRCGASADDDLHHTYRLAKLAQQQVNAVIDAFDPFVGVAH